MPPIQDLQAENYVQRKKQAWSTAAELLSQANPAGDEPSAQNHKH